MIVDVQDRNIFINQDLTLYVFQQCSCQTNERVYCAAGVRCIWRSVLFKGPSVCKCAERGGYQGKKSTEEIQYFTLYKKEITSFACAVHNGNVFQIS